MVKKPFFSLLSVTPTTVLKWNASDQNTILKAMEAEECFGLTFE